MSESKVNDNAYAGRPSVCWNCGALVGAGESSCSVCGAPSSAAQSASQESAAQRRAPDPETLSFVRAIISRPATFTFVVLVSNLFVFLLMQLSGGSENPEVLRAFGAKYNSLINEGQWWRLVTPVFMHIGWIHLLVNMYSLFMLGPYVERIYGSAKFIVFWVLTGIAGVGASYFASMHQMHDGVLGGFLFRGGDGPSAGASGALFGLVGVLFVFGIKFRHELPEGFKRAFGTGMLPTIMINLFIGYTVPMIDNAAHIGGFLAGMVLALFVDYRRPGESAPVAFAWQVLRALAIGLVITSFALVWTNFTGPRPSFESAGERLLSGGAADPDAFLNAMNGGQEAFRKTMLGDREAATAAIKRLDETRGLNQNADALRKDLQFLLVRAQNLAVLEPQGRAAQQARAQNMKKVAEDYGAWQERFKKWVETEGRDYGLFINEAQPQQSPAEGNGKTDDK